MSSLSTRLRGSLRRALPVIVGVSFAALVPVAALASNSGGLTALEQEVQTLTGQTNTNTSEIQALQAQVSDLETQVTDQQKTITALQNQVNNLPGSTDDDSAFASQSDLSALTNRVQTDELNLNNAVNFASASHGDLFVEYLAENPF